MSFDMGIDFKSVPMSDCPHVKPVLALRLKKSTTAPVCEHFTGGVMAWRAHHASARMRPGAAQVETPNRGAILGSEYWRSISRGEMT